MARKQTSQRKVLFLLSILIFIIVIFTAACGSSTATTSASTSSNLGAHIADRSVNQSVSNSAAAGGSAQNTSSSATNVSSSSQNSGPAYLIKTLKVTLQVKDTRQSAGAIAAWISSTDPRSTSAGANYTQMSDTAYNVELIYDVQSTLYPQIYNYLRDYSSQKGANSKLVNFNEGVQDVTNDYVDTQSRLKNYKGEQARLLTFLSQAQNVNDILSIEQKLTDVESNIETNEAHLNLLANQVTYYTVTIELQPLFSTPPPQVQTVPGWSFGQVFGGAFSASLDLGRSLLTFIIWILAFSIYIIPVLIIIFLVRKYGYRIPTLFAPVKTVQTPPKVE